MLSLTRKADYGLVALAYLGQQRAQGGGATSAREIAERFGLPLPFLMNLLKDLVQSGIITSTRGPHGGYALATEPGDITLMQVLQAIEGPVQFARCADTLPVMGKQCQPDQACPIAEVCPIREPIRRLHERISDFLDQVTLEDLFEQRECASMLQIQV